MNERRARESNASILVVDDKPATLRLLVEILKRKGYRVRQLSDGEMVLSSALDDPPNLILLDLLMPGTDGIEVCERLKADERTRDIPVIFFSALNEEVNKVRAFSAGGVDFITKPFKKVEVLARVETHLSLREAQRRLQEQNATLQREVADRDRAEEELKSKNERLEIFNRLAVDRELKMVELKKEINALLEESGKPSRYLIAE